MQVEDHVLQGNSGVRAVAHLAGGCAQATSAAARVSTSRITSTRSSGSNGFVTYSSAPSSWARARSLSPDFAEHTTTDGRVARPPSSASTNQPSSTGIMMSSTTRSGCSSSMRRNAVSPSAASEGSNPSASRIIRSVRSTSGSSSTMSTLGLPCMRHLPRSFLYGTGAERHAERGAPARGFLNPDRALTGLHEATHDGEPQTHSWFRPVRVNSVEPLEDLLPDLRRDPGAVVHDREHHLVVVRLDGDPDGRYAVFMGVLDQVSQDPAHGFGIGPHLAGCRGLDLDRPPRDLRVERREADERGQVDAAQQGALAVLFHLRRGQDLLDHQLEPVRLAFDHLEELDALIGRHG